MVLGLCQAGKKCYAKKAEIQYPAVLPYRRRQAEITSTVSPDDFVSAFNGAVARARNKPTAFRFNESGDFKNQAQLDWFASVCSALPVPCYGYTARTDLDLSQLLKVARVNVSNDIGGWIRKGANRFKLVKETTSKLSCPGSCKKCSMCQKLKGKTIQIQLH